MVDWHWYWKFLIVGSLTAVIWGSFCFVLAINNWYKFSLLVMLCFVLALYPLSVCVLKILLKGILRRDVKFSTLIESAVDEGETGSSSRTSSRFETLAAGMFFLISCFLYFIAISLLLFFPIFSVIALISILLNRKKAAVKQ